MATAKGTGGASVLTGLIVAVAAVVPLAWAASTGGADQAVFDSNAEPVVELVSTTTAPAEVTETIVIAPDPVEVDGLPESVVRALEAAGNVRAEGSDELGLPASVVNVLADHDVVLRVAEEAAP